MMPPPNLPRNTRIFDIFHPGKIGITPTFRDDPNPVFPYHLYRRFRQWFDLHEPLRRQIRLDHGLTAVTTAHGMTVRFDLFQKASFFQLCDDQLPRLKSILRVIAIDPISFFTAGSKRRTIETRFGVKDADSAQSTGF